MAVSKHSCCKGGTIVASPTNKKKTNATMITKSLKMINLFLWFNNDVTIFILANTGVLVYITRVDFSLSHFNVW